MILSGPRRFLASSKATRLSFSSHHHQFGRHTHIILPDVNTLAPNLDGDVHAVVDEQGHAVPPRHGVQPRRRLDGRGARAVLVAVLEDGDAAPQRGLDHVLEVPAAAEDGRGRVGDEVEAVVDGWFGHGLLGRTVGGVSIGVEIDKIGYT